MLISRFTRQFGRARFFYSTISAFDDTTCSMTCDISPNCLRTPFRLSFISIMEMLTFPHCPTLTLFGWVILRDATKAGTSVQIKPPWETTRMLYGVDRSGTVERYDKMVEVHQLCDRRTSASVVSELASLKNLVWPWEAPMYYNLISWKWSILNTRFQRTLSRRPASTCRVTLGWWPSMTLAV